MHLLDIDILVTHITIWHIYIEAVLTNATATTMTTR